MNRDIASVLVKLGHMDTIVIAECGLPIPDNIPCIDVSLELGNPSFMSVLKIIMSDMEIEELILAQEIKSDNESLYKEIVECHSLAPITYISHEELILKLCKVKAVIRTGEATPYANVILQAGVIF